MGIMKPEELARLDRIAEQLRFQVSDSSSAAPEGDQYYKGRVDAFELALDLISDAIADLSRV